MCGVAGFWQKDGKKVDESILQKMVQKLYHRGPDDNGVWKNDTLGFAHTRLSILDLSNRGHQPFVTSDGKGVLSFNGEIYNFRELRGELEKEGVSFTSTSDTEVLLYALHVWGPENAIPKLEGMFGFAYYDLRSSTLWLSRDRSGMKPLYWVDKPNVYIFASEMKALFEHPDFSCQADMHTLTTHILLRRLDGDWTPFEDVRSVLPGTMIKIHEGKPETITYFDILRDVDVDRILSNDNVPLEKLVEEFRNVFSHSVNSHLVSDAPLAAMCSGGLDSSLMAAVAKEHKADLNAYVAEVDDVPVSEADKAQTVCDHIGVPLRRVKINQETYIRMWPEAAYYNDQPNFFSQNILYMAVCKVARQDGFKVLLTGEGSDELYGGYDWHKDTYRMWRLRRLHSMLFPNTRFLRKLGNYFTKLAPLNFERLMDNPFARKSEMSLFHQATATQTAIDGAQRRVRAQDLFKKLEKITPIEKRAFLARGMNDFYTHLRTLLLANDKMAMATSIEGRFPFLSNQSIDFGLHLNLNAKFKNKITKYIVKTAAEPKLPHQIVHAKKIGFGFSKEFWDKGISFLRGGMVEDMFKWGEREAASIYKDLEWHKRYLFVLMSVELWARLFLKNESYESLSEELMIALK